MAEIAEQALQAVADIDDPWRRGWNLLLISKAFARIGRIEQAAEAAEQMRQAAASTSAVEKQASRLCSVAEAFARIGWIEQAAEAAEQALQAAGAIEDPGMRSYELNNVATVLAGVGRAEWATEAAEQAAQAAVAADNPESQVRNLSRAARTLADAGRAERAAEVAEWALPAVPSVRYPDTLRRLAEAFASAGQREQALQVAGSIGDPTFRSQALQKVAEVLAGEDRPEQDADSFGLPEQALQEALRIAEDPDDKLLWALRPASADRQVKPLPDTAQVLAAVTSIDRPKPRAEALIKVAEALALGGDAEQAADVAEQALSLLFNPCFPCCPESLVLPGVSW